MLSSPTHSYFPQVPLECLCLALTTPQTPSDPVFLLSTYKIASSSSPEVPQPPTAKKPPQTNNTRLTTEGLMDNLEKEEDKWKSDTSKLQIFGLIWENGGQDVRVFVCFYIYKLLILCIHNWTGTSWCPIRYFKWMCILDRQEQGCSQPLVILSQLVAWPLLSKLYFWLQME